MSRGVCMLEKARKNTRAQLAITMLFTGIAFVISYMTNFFLAPYITREVGADAYGYITLARNFSNYAMILTTALNSYAARFISVEYHRRNYKKANEFFSSVFYANLVLVGVIILIAGIVIIKLEDIFVIPNKIVLDSKILFMLVFISFGITSVGTAFTASAYIRNRLDLTGIFKGCSYFIEAFTIFGLFILFGPTLWFVGLGLVFAAIEIFISNYLITKRLTPELIIKKSSFSLSAVKTLVVNGIWNSINNLGNTLNTGLDLVITNLLLTPLAMGQLAYAKTIGTMFSTLYQLISQPFQPIFLKLYAEKKKEELVKELVFSMKISGFFSSVAFGGFVALGTVYFRLWIPGQDIDLIQILTILTILSCLGEGAISPLFYVYTLTTKFKIPCMVTLIGGFFNVAGMYFLIRYTNLGVYAVVITTAVISSIINIIFNPLYIAKCLKVRLLTFAIPMFKHILSCSIITIFYIVLAKVYTPSSWLGLIICAIVYGIFGLAIHVLVTCSKDERVKLKHMIRRMV